MKKELVLILMLLFTLSVFSQQPPEEFFKGLDLLKTDADLSCLIKSNSIALGI